MKKLDWCALLWITFQILIAQPEDTVGLSNIGQMKDEGHDNYLTNGYDKNDTNAINTVYRS